jgi:hypothetical protein
VPHAVGHPGKKPPGGLKARPLHCGSAGYVVFRFLRARRPLAADAVVERALPAGCDSSSTSMSTPASRNGSMRAADTDRIQVAQVLTTAM